MASPEEEEEEDLYGDLPKYSYSENIDELQSTNKQLEDRLSQLSSRVEQLVQDNEELQKKYGTLLKNYSSLMQSASGEIKRRDRRITELNEEILFYRSKSSKLLPRRGEERDRSRCVERDRKTSQGKGTREAVVPVNSTSVRDEEHSKRLRSSGMEDGLDHQGVFKKRKTPEPTDLSMRKECKNKDESLESVSDEIHPSLLNPDSRTKNMELDEPAGKTIRRIAAPAFNVPTLYSQRMFNKIYPIISESSHVNKSSNDEETKKQNLDVHKSDLNLEKDSEAIPTASTTIASDNAVSVSDCETLRKHSDGLPRDKDPYDELNVKGVNDYRTSNDDLKENTSKETSAINCPGIVIEQKCRQDPKNRFSSNLNLKRLNRHVKTTFSPISTQWSDSFRKSNELQVGLDKNKDEAFGRTSSILKKAENEKKKSDLVEELFGSPLKWTENSSDGAKLCPPPSAFEDSCSAHIENVKFKAVSSSEGVSSITYVQERTVSRDLENMTLMKTESRVSLGEKTFKQIPPRPFEDINLEKRNESFSSIHETTNEACDVPSLSSMLMVPPVRAPKYCDPILGQFDDTTQLISALAKEHSKISPIHTPLKQPETTPSPNELNSSSKDINLRNDPSERKGVFPLENKAHKTCFLPITETKFSDTTPKTSAPISTSKTEHLIHSPSQKQPAKSSNKRTILLTETPVNILQPRRKTRKENTPIKGQAKAKPVRTVGSLAEGFVQTLSKKYCELSYETPLEPLSSPQTPWHEEDQNVPNIMPADKTKLCPETPSSTHSKFDNIQIIEKPVNIISPRRIKRKPSTPNKTLARNSNPVQKKLLQHKVDISVNNIPKSSLEKDPGGPSASVHRKEEIVQPTSHMTASNKECPSTERVHHSPLITENDNDKNVGMCLESFKGSENSFKGTDMNKNESSKSLNEQERNWGSPERNRNDPRLSGNPKDIRSNFKNPDSIRDEGKVFGSLSERERNFRNQERNINDCRQTESLRERGGNFRSPDRNKSFETSRGREKMSESPKRDDRRRSPSPGDKERQARILVRNRYKGRGSESLRERQRNKRSPDRKRYEYRRSLSLGERNNESLDGKRYESRQSESLRERQRNHRSPDRKRREYRRSPSPRNRNNQCPEGMRYESRELESLRERKRSNQSPGRKRYERRRSPSPRERSIQNSDGKRSESMQSESLSDRHDQSPGRKSRHSGSSREREQCNPSPERTKNRKQCELLNDQERQNQSPDRNRNGSRLYESCREKERKVISPDRSRNESKRSDFSRERDLKSPKAMTTEWLNKTPPQPDIVTKSSEADSSKKAANIEFKKIDRSPYRKFKRPLSFMRDKKRFLRESSVERKHYRDTWHRARLARDFKRAQRNYRFSRDLRELCRSQNITEKMVTEPLGVCKSLNSPAAIASPNEKYPRIYKGSTSAKENVNEKIHHIVRNSRKIDWKSSTEVISVKGTEENTGESKMEWILKKIDLEQPKLLRSDGKSSPETDFVGPSPSQSIPVPASKKSPALVIRRRRPVKFGVSEPVVESCSPHKVKD